MVVLKITRTVAEIRYILRYLGFFTVLLLILIFIYATSDAVPFKTIKLNEKNSTKTPQYEKCEDIFKQMQKLHSSVGRSNPHEQKRVVVSQNQLSVRSGWILDKEWIEIRKSPPGSKITVTNHDIQSIINRIVNKKEYNSYADFNLEKVISENMAKRVKGAKIGVIGLYELPYNPWIESLLDWASNSSAQVTLIDFQPREYENMSKFKWIDSRTYFDTMATSRQSDQFDIVINYFVGERLGLGRYGEDVSIDADLITMAQCKCMLKPDGLALLAITLIKEMDKVDSEGFVVNNVCRVYGDARVKKLVDGWTILTERLFDFDGIKLLVLQKNV